MNALLGSLKKTSGKTLGKILAALVEDVNLTIPELASLIGATGRSIERNIRKLQEQGRLRRVGPAKGGALGDNLMNSASDKFTDYYRLLGINAKADRQAVKQAYLAKIKEWHPDKNPDRTEEAEEKTKALNQAYHILGDPEQRKNYDRMLRYTEGKDFNECINDEVIREKLSKAYPALKTALKNVRVLYALFKDTVNGKFKMPPASVAMIGGGLLYFILPADLIPDFIPVIGYVDDLAVLTTIMNSLKKEIGDYRIWKEK